ncbi:hypothetical protein H0B56_18930 [Haloechinothrix sp. YIM 98757]|uniref:Uncharacterized protein n=1 Tax=Haloechinothrix aidingensis TaxID=2752311 RepID=A0A838AEB1_9PSEU|nr:hypothetical protein [Haloechinothrix aidingensis]MBA0127622.1 hypothetical protein [Haloechinothrix aidingensis]
MVECEDRIGTDPPADDLAVVSGVAALPDAGTSGPLQAVPRVNGLRLRYFAKRGLVAGSDRTIDLVVPPEERHRLAITWGSPGRLTWHLRVSCHAADATWLTFAGGYVTTRRGCVSLIVRADGRQERARIGVGARCVEE